MVASYVSDRGRVVELSVTAHARARLAERARAAGLEVGSVEEEFGRACRVRRLSWHERRRRRRHGEDTLYFRSSRWTFVVQDATIMTVELHGEHRALNRGVTL